MRNSDVFSYAGAWKVATSKQEKDMPRGSVRNIPNLRKGRDHLNQFEFQKRHGEMTAESEMPFGAQTYKSEQTQSKDAKQTPGQLHEIYDPRKRGVVKM